MILVRGWYDQNHSRPQHRDVAVAALQTSHGGAVGVGDRVERFPRPHPVVYDRNFFSVLQALDLRRLGGRGLDTRGFGF